uniref:Uncharacterized protein n=1 Tax=Oryza nivara TaxID=4536 RepID=A0A0E0HJC5_ORYNI
MQEAASGGGCCCWGRRRKEESKERVTMNGDSGGVQDAKSWLQYMCGVWAPPLSRSMGPLILQCHSPL